MKLHWCFAFNAAHSSDFHSSWWCGWLTASCWCWFCWRWWECYVDDKDAEVDVVDKYVDVDDEDIAVDTAVDDDDDKHEPAVGTVMADDLLKGRDFVSLLATIAFLESGQIPAFWNLLLRWAGQSDCFKSCAIRPGNTFVTVAARLNLVTPFQNISPLQFSLAKRHSHPKAAGDGWYEVGGRVDECYCS